MRIDCPNCDASQEYYLTELDERGGLLECEKFKNQFHASKDVVLPTNVTHAVIGG